MKHTVMLIPVCIGVGLPTVAMGLVRAFENQGVKVAFLQPISQSKEKIDQGDLFSLLDESLPIKFVEHLLSKGREEEFLEYMIAKHERVAKEVDVVVLSGIISSELRIYAARLNRNIAQALDAEVIFVASPREESPAVLYDQIEIAAQIHGGVSHPKVLGVMINKVGSPVDSYGNTRIDLFDLEETATEKRDFCAFFENRELKVLGCFPWERRLMAPRVKDVALFLHADVIAKGKMEQHRVMNFVLAAATVENLTKAFKPHVIIITPGDRSDIILATCMAYLGGMKIAGLLLSCGLTPPSHILSLCHDAIEAGLPILSVGTDSLRTSISLQNLDADVPLDDLDKLEEVKEYISSLIDQKWIKEFVSTYTERHLSPAAFRYQLVEKARRANKTIILPEGEEPRIIEAAAICSERHIAHCQLLGNPTKIQKIAKDHGIILGEKIGMIDPKSIEEEYVTSLVEIRKHKGLLPEGARDMLHDPIVLGMMMLALDQVDGLVAGSVTTSAHTIRPALQIIKTRPGTTLASSAFFMCLPDKILVYADCAVNPNPSADELVDIAIESAETAKKFGIHPIIAMISYSTGSSGEGADVEKVLNATEKLKKLRPDLTVDGPLQYDAAFSEKVAKIKAPESPVAGKATVYIFPDLNTANTTYKAVQRSAEVLSVGPILQGLKKPVNDLSRGASVDDIVYTIAITAVQAI